MKVEYSSNVVKEARLLGLIEGCFQAPAKEDSGLEHFSFQGMLRGTA
jgi:hypothetical protein